MSTRFSNFMPVTPDQLMGFYGANWNGRNFVATATHDIESIFLYLGRETGTTPGDVTASIYAVDGTGKPTGAPLCTSTIDGNTVIGIASNWVEFVFASPANLDQGVTYAIVLSAPSASSGDVWAYGTSTDQDPSGVYLYSGDSGVTWNALATWDMSFQEWGSVSIPLPFPIHFPIDWKPSLPAWSGLVKIAGVDTLVDKDSLSIDTQIEERSIASFTLTDWQGTHNYQKGDSVEIGEEAARLFTGYIDAPEQSRLSAAGGRKWRITCADQHYLADKRLAVNAYPWQTDSWLTLTPGRIVMDLFTDYLEPEGVKIGEIQDGDALFATPAEGEPEPRVVLNYVRVSDVLDALSQKAGFIWWIDENRRLYFVARETNVAPWTLTAGDIIKGSASVVGGSSFYRNRQYIRGVTGITQEQNEVFYGDGFTQSFFTKFPIITTPVIYVGVDLQTVGESGVDAVDKQWYWTRGSSELWAWTAPPSTGPYVRVAYIGQYQTVVKREDALAIPAVKAIEGGTGITEDVADEAVSEPVAIASADGKLADYCRTALRFRFQTDRAGLRPGQLLTVYYPFLGLDGDFLVESIHVSVSAGIYYDVTAIQGPATGSWAKYFRALREPVSADPLTMGADPPVVILASFAATVSDPVIKYLAWGVYNTPVTGIETKLAQERARVPVTSIFTVGGVTTVRAILTDKDANAADYLGNRIEELGWFAGDATAYPTTGTLVLRKLYHLYKNNLKQVVVDLTYTPSQAPWMMDEEGEPILDESGSALV